MAITTDSYKNLVVSIIDIRAIAY